MIRATFSCPDGTQTTSTWPEPEPKWKMQHAAWMRDALYWTEQEVPDGDDAPVLAGVPARVPDVFVSGPWWSFR